MPGNRKPDIINETEKSIQASRTPLTARGRTSVGTGAPFYGGGNGRFTFRADPITGGFAPPHLHQTVGPVRGRWQHSSNRDRAHTHTPIRAGTVCKASVTGTHMVVDAGNDFLIEFNRLPWHDRSTMARRWHAGSCCVFFPTASVNKLCKLYCCFVFCFCSVNDRWMSGSTFRKAFENNLT